MVKKSYLTSCLLLFSFIAFSQKVYIAENGATEIRRSNVDGTVQELISIFPSTVGAMRSMVFDEQRNTIFWIESNTIIRKGTLTVIGGNTRLNSSSIYASVTGAVFQSLAINPITRELLVSSNGGIYKLSLDAASTITVLPAATIAPFNISNFDVDLVNSKIYFIRPITTTEIWMANLDGTGQIKIVPNLSGTESMRDITVDPVGGKIYYTNVSGATAQIVTRNLAGADPAVPIVTSLPNTIGGITLDANNGYLFWADGATGTAGAIGRANLDGSGKINIYTGLNAPVDVAIDFSSSLPPKLYWTEPGTTTREVHRINTSGTDFERYFFNSGSTPNGIAIDQRTRIAYWTDEAQANIIKGTISETTFSALDTLVDYPNPPTPPPNGINGIALDPTNHMMYFAYTVGNKIQRVDYNIPTPFGPIPPASIQDLATITQPFGVALDLVRGKLYYTSNSLGPTNTGTLSRSNLDGTSPEVLITQSVASPQRFMHDVKVDAKNGFVYWVFTEANGLATIYKADIANVSGTVTPLINNTAGEIRGIEIDVQADKLWWVSRGIVGSIAPAIKSAKLSDGLGITTLHTITFTPPPRANFIALDKGCEQPIAFNLSINAPLGQTAVADPLPTAYFNPADVLQVSIATAPTKGVASVGTDNRISYTPNSATIGSDVISYQICNQCGLCDLAVVNILIPNEPPVIAPPASVSAVTGSSVTIPIAGLLSDPNNNLDIATLAVVSQPASGASASFNSNNELVINYSGITFTGTDNLTIQVCDTSGSCTTQVITVAVTAPPPTPPPTPTPTPTPTSEIIVYNALSPNGDLFNPYFKIENIETVAPENKVSIFNRWGDKVFEVENYVNDDPVRRFNGESNKGNALPSGVYFYKIDFRDGRTELTGYLTLKR